MKTAYTVAIQLMLIAACGNLDGVSAGKSGPEAVRAELLSRVTGTVSLQYLDMIPVPGLDHAPDGISAGIDGSLYLCDTSGGRVLRLDRSGTVLASFGDIDSRTGTVFAPSDISVSGGIEVYVLDSGTSRILRLDRNLKNAYTVYSPEQNREHLFGTFQGIAFDRTSGDLFVTDSDNGTIIRIDTFGGNIQSSGSFGQGRTSLREPYGIDVTDDSTILVADRRGGVVVLQRHFGSTMTIIGKDLLMQPVDVTALPEGLIAVADRQGVVVFDRNGVPLAFAGFQRESSLIPRAITYTDGILLVSDDGSGGIVRFKVQ